MAETVDFNSRLEELRAKNPDVYDSIVRWYGPSDLQALHNDESVFNAFAAQFEEEVKNRETADSALDSAVKEETEAAGLGDDAAPEDAAASQTDETAAAEQNVSDETNAMISDPFHWEEFYAPAPEVETARFNEAYELLNSEKGKEFQQNAAWQSSSFAFDNEDKTLGEALDLSACRRLASSNEEINSENLTAARAEESARIKIEYYNALYVQAVGDKYNSIRAETHLQRILKLDEAVRAGKDEKEIFKMLAINPNATAKQKALNVTAHANMQPIADFVDSRKKFSRGMHNLGKVMDRIQKFEQKNPLFGLGANYLLAGNPVYMGYRSVLSARALYNDFQGFKDYAAFREVYKNNIDELGLKRWQEQNPDSKTSQNDYNQVKAYDTYAAYCETHRVEANRVSEDEFLQLKKFQKKAAFTREEFESLRQSAALPYEEYAKKAGDKAISEEMFNNLVKYTDVRRTQNYAEYTKKAGDRAVSEQEYNRIRTLNRSLEKVSVGQALKDKTTRKAMIAHSVIFVRSMPVVGQGYALGMAVKNMASKSYWQGLKAKAQGTGHAIKTLWSKKGRDKEAWKELYSNGSGLLAESAGAWMLASGVNSTVQYGEQFIEGMQTSGHSFAEHAEQEISRSVNDSINRIQNPNIVEEIVNTPDTVKTRFQSLFGFGGQEVRTEALAADSAVVDKVTRLNVSERADSINTIERADTLSMAERADSLRMSSVLNHVERIDSLNEQGFKFENQAAASFSGSFFAADSTAVDDVKVPYARGEQPMDDNVTETLVEPAASSVKLNAEQKQNLESLFTQYPRAASIILEGNDNPTVTDVTKGTFTMEGEENLYKSGVISTAQLKEMLTEGKFTAAQLESLSKFADANFENGKMNAELAAQLYGSGEVTQSETQSRKLDGDGKDEHRNERKDEQTNEENGEQENKKGEDNVRFYSFDKDGNVIYRLDALQDLAGLDADALDAQMYKDLLARQANGEQLDAGALKFLESYREAHPDLSQEKSNVSTEEKKTETVLTDREAEEQIRGIALTRYDFESGKGYEMSGSVEINGKTVDVVNLFDEHDRQVVSQYTILEGDDHSTVIKVQLGDNGRAYALVTEIDGDKTTTREVDNPREALRQAFAAKETQGGQVTAGLEESRNLTNDDENGNDGEKEVQTKTDKVRSSTFRGKYWLEAEVNGNTPQLRCQMGDLSQIAVDRTLVEAFKNTVDGSGSHYTALGGRLTADNFGAENRDNPNASGIMVKCEQLAQTIAVNEAVYQDMEHRLEKGDQLTELDMKWRQKYEKDLDDLGLVRENGRLVYEPQHASTATSSLEQEETRNDQGNSRRIYQLNNDAQNGGKEQTETSSEEKITEKSEVQQSGNGQPDGYTTLEGKGVKIAYSLTENGTIRYANNATIHVDQTVLRAIRSQYENPFLTPSESGESLTLARNITKDEVVYDHLQAQSGERELTGAEKVFMRRHDEQLKENGLTHDINGEIVKENANNGQPRAAIRRGRGR